MRSSSRPCEVALNVLGRTRCKPKHQLVLPYLGAESNAAPELFEETSINVALGNFDAVKS
jgi:hypothetical protein